MPRHPFTYLLIALLWAIATSASALTFRLPADNDELVGDLMTYKAEYEDTFARLARVYGLGYLEMLAANPGVNPWVPGEGTEVILPLAYILPEGERRGVVLNLPEKRLYYYVPDEDTVLTYAMGIGRQGLETPVMRTRITGKIENPSWTPPRSVREERASRGEELPAIVPPGPDNPLGRFAIQLDVPGYFIHGSNSSMGIGMRVSHGCIRLYDDDIEEMARRVPVGTQVEVVNQPFKAGWHRGELYLEAHEPLEEKPVAEEEYREVITAALARRPGRNVDVDWDKAANVAGESRGIPVVISRSASH